MHEPARLQTQATRYALVDGISFQMPVACVNSPALFAVFTIDAKKAKALLPGNEVHPLRLWKRALLIVSVIDYLQTNIGKYIEFSIAIACTHGNRPAPRLLPALFMGAYGTGQYVVDLPVSTEISVKGGKGIWGMSKHQANLDYQIDQNEVSSQYDLDGQLCLRVSVRKPKGIKIPFKAGAVNYCQFRGMLMKSRIYFRGKLGFTFCKKGAAQLLWGDHPRMAALKALDISPEPLLTGFISAANGTLDDHMESWFLTSAANDLPKPEGMESVVNLGLSEEWLSPPSAAARLKNSSEAKS